MDASIDKNEGFIKQPGTGFIELPESSRDPENAIKDHALNFANAFNNEEKRYRKAREEGNAKDEAKSEQNIRDLDNRLQRSLGVTYSSKAQRQQLLENLSNIPDIKSDVLGISKRNVTDALAGLVGRKPRELGSKGASPIDGISSGNSGTSTPITDNSSGNLLVDAYNKERSEADVNKEVNKRVPVNEDSETGQGLKIREIEADYFNTKLKGDNRMTNEIYSPALNASNLFLFKTSDGKREFWIFKDSKSDFNYLRGVADGKPLSKEEASKYFKDEELEGFKFDE